MRTTRAYIASFGTTGTLIAAALLTMSVMSAIVAFDGFPGQSLQDPVSSLPVLDRQAPLAVDKHSAQAGALHAFHVAQAGVGAAARHQRHADSARAPVAHANPLVHRESVTPRQAQQQPGASSPQSAPVTVPDAGSVTSGVTHAVPPAPSLPSPQTLLKSSPVTLPGGSTLPVDLPINTAAVSGVVDTLAGQ